MNADGAFRMGRNHAVCQDYVFVQGRENPHVLLADGCSSSPDTDIGARLLVRAVAAQRHREKEAGAGCDGEGSEAAGLGFAVCRAREWAGALALDAQTLDATLLEIQVQGTGWTAEVHGDGVLAWEDTEGLIHAVSLTYRSNYPHYPNYHGDPARYAAFQALPDNERQREEIVLLPEGSVEIMAQETDLAGSPCYRREGNIRTVRWIAVLSDGVHSFVQTRAIEGRTITTPIVWHDVLRELLAFKHLKGAFVQRRLQRFLQQCEASGRQHRDDISIGAVATDIGQ